MTARDLAKAFEGCVLKAYRDPAGIWTIGYGHTGKDVYEGQIWTQDQADTELDHDLKAAAALLNLYSPNLPNGAREALTDFVFNLGIGNYRTSQLCRFVNQMDWPAAKSALLDWDHVNGHVVAGLLRRRQAEAALI